jgi:hypothetical protein
VLHILYISTMFLTTKYFRSLLYCYFLFTVHAYDYGLEDFRCPLLVHDFSSSILRRLLTKEAPCFQKFKK